VETVMTNETRVVIIGAGHNGLVAACYLAKAGFAPLIIERRSIIGGLAVTEEIYPGFRCPGVAHVAGPLLPQVMEDLELPKYGLKPLGSAVGLVVLHPDGNALRIYEDPRQTAVNDLARISPPDAEKYPQFDSTLRRLGEVIAPLLSVVPPDIDNLKINDYFNLGKVGLRFRSLESRDAHRLLRWGPMPIADLAAEWFKSELLRATIEAQGIFGSFAGPRSPGTSVGLLRQAALGEGGRFVLGGPGSITQTLATIASSAGAQIRTNARVIRIGVKNGRATSVVLESGEEIQARIVVCCADPKHTFLQLLEPGELEPNFMTKVQSYRAAGSVAKMNLALSALPKFAGVKDANRDLSRRIQIGPDTDYLEQAFDAAKYGDFSPRPYLDITIPSLTDPSLAPNGAHVMSIHMQYAPYRLKNGDWNTRRDELGDAILKTLCRYAPKISELIVHRQILTPLDIERTYGVTGGHIFHGEHALDQLFAFRPLLGWAQYRTPIEALYLCGAGTHPGGGITGAPGFNASREIIKDLKASGKS
jgi:phytoene dehydrogenase-like protein